MLIFFLCSGVRGTSDTEAKQRDELYAEALKLRCVLEPVQGWMIICLLVQLDRSHCTRSF